MLTALLAQACVSAEQVALPEIDPRTRALIVVLEQGSSITLDARTIADPSAVAFKLTLRDGVRATLLFFDRSLAELQLNEGPVELLSIGPIQETRATPL